MDKELSLACELTALLSCALNVSGDSIKQPFSKNGHELAALFTQAEGHSDNLIVPSMLLVGSIRDYSSNLQEMGAQSFAIPMSARQDKINEMPMKLLLNLGNSLMKMMDSQLDAAVLGLVHEQQVKTGSSEEPTIQAHVLRQLVSTSNPVVPTTIVTEFQAATDATLAQGNKLVTPIEMKAIVDLQVLGKSIKPIQLTVPGSLSIVFRDIVSCGFQPIVQAAQLRVDTQVLIQSLQGAVQQVVDKTVASVRETALTPGTRTAQRQLDQRPDDQQHLLNTGNAFIGRLDGFQMSANNFIFPGSTSGKDEMNTAALRAFAGGTSTSSSSLMMAPEQADSLEPRPINSAPQENQSNEYQMDRLQMLSSSLSGTKRSHIATSHSSSLKRIKQDQAPDLAEKEGATDPSYNDNAPENFGVGGPAFV